MTQRQWPQGLTRLFGSRVWSNRGRAGRRRQRQEGKRQIRQEWP